MGDFLELDFRRLFAWLRAGLLLACVLGLIGAAAGVAYGMLATKRFTVATDILINPANLRVVEDDLFSQAGQVDAQVLTARSKQRVLTSRNVLSHVVEQLDLANDPEFNNPAAASIGDTTDPKLRALSQLSRNVGVEADETSFVTTLRVSAESADKAITISQAIVRAFQEELVRTETEGATRAATALDGRLEQLKGDVMRAEERVEAYRRENNLSSTNGQLVSSQTMTQLNTQIVQAEARATAAQSNLDTLVAGGANGTNADPSVSENLSTLRNQANSIRQELESQSAQLGPRHPAIQRLRASLATVDAQVEAEYRNTVEVARASRDAAQGAVAALTTRMNELQGGVFSDRASEVALRELERDAASRTAIYESFLARARQITERQGLDTTNVQVISSPVPPEGRSWPPRTLLLLIAGGVLGFGLGMLLAIALGARRDLRPTPVDPRFSAV
ncbi:MAG: lipopolysaccharide biosynthesis protein [Mesorhizobium amorphae]|nr:MAG: lipopolysaccharide biosynthesis protein [Mesorhizobium amorphae]